MAKLAPFRSWVDTAGDPLASGKVYTYSAGTTTNKATYTDSGAGTAHPNPVVLDSSGSKDIWLLTDEKYKFVVKDSDDTTIVTIDNVEPLGHISSLGADLDVNGNSIVSSSNGNIPITPNGTGNLVLDGLNWPQADGTANQILQTDGAAQLSWATADTSLVNDTSPQLGGDLDTNSYNIQFDTGTGITDENSNEQLLFTTTASAVNYLNITNSITGSGPTLAPAGSDTNIDIKLTPKGSGQLNLDGLKWPSADGSTGEGIITDGSGNLSFGTPSLSLVQRVSTTSTASSSTTTILPFDNTIPQNTEGAELITLEITPTSSSNILRIEAFVSAISVTSGDVPVIALFQDSTANALAAGVAEGQSDLYGCMYLTHFMAAGTTSATTFKIRVGPGTAGTLYWLKTASVDPLFGGAGEISLIITEYAV